MNKFKVVIRSNYSGTYWYKSHLGEEFGVIQSPSSPDCWQTVDAGRGILKSDCELAWQPTPGDMIEVTIDRWGLLGEREFVAMVGDQYLYKVDEKHQLHWAYIFALATNASPLKKTHTITDSQGRTAEISDDSFKAMDHLFN